MAKYNIKPFPAVRVNSKAGRFTPNAKKYHQKMDNLRDLIEQWKYTKQEIMEALISWNYFLRFHFKVAKSWSKEKQANMLWEVHQQTPDIDNLFKAFTDTVFYGQKEYNDCKIWKIRADKFWSDKDFIEFEIR